MLTRWAGILRNAVAGIGLLYVVAYLLVASSRLAYPYEVEWIEGGVLDHVARVLAGDPLYVKPSIAFTPFLYTPLYFYISALLASVTDLGMLPLRLVSLLASLASFGLIFEFVRRETRCIRSALVAVGTFASAYGLVAAWYDQARVDSLALALLLASAFSLRFATSVRGHALAGAWLTLALLTKQTALVAAAPFGLYALLVAGWVPAAAFLGTFALLGGACILGSNWASDGWFWFYVFDLPTTHKMLPQRLATFWFDDLLYSMPVACAAVAYFVFGLAPRSLPLRPSEHSRFLFWSLLVVTLVGLSMGGRLHTGAYVNVLMPAYAALSLGLGLGLHRSIGLPAEAPGDVLQDSPSRGPLRTIIILALCGAQLLALAWDPRRYLPTDANRASGDQLLEAIRSIPGEVWITDNGYLGTLAGKRSHMHTLAMDDVGRGGSSAIVRELQRDIVGAIESQRFDAIIVGGIFSRQLRKKIEQSYRNTGPVLKPASARFGAVTGSRENPRLYLPKP